ncbi:flagellar motor protein MotB [Pelagovum pacificum]|uniref:Chemotaxis protein MotB n=1 Tax=Pelagovum pacificum TaxID=2588711 RepID=A0A5C5GHD7_9RHOB|nr:flagellar motor protein MotB [Pelagovum pacificum]QQA42726.1 OmpA family protein [Pelagovum pacificum]TNY34123.1 chemotaxis protein MotB [Pelagovum pacificum]
MAATNAPIIIKRKKVVAGDGHHGGAWKVAYADFVTAMMAFFMLMWLLNATTEQQRKGIADYFSPTIPINRMSGGGSGTFGGSSIFTDDTLADNGQVAIVDSKGEETTFALEDGGDPERDEDAQVAALREVESELLGRGGESMLSDEALRHVITRVTDEGLIIEIFDIDDGRLFEPGTADPAPVTVELARSFARVFRMVENAVAVEGHVRARPAVVVDNPVWSLSSDRAAQLHELLEEGGLDPARVARVTGHADRQPADADLVSVRNNRIEIILLRSDQ